MPWKNWFCFPDFQLPHHTLSPLASSSISDCGLSNGLGDAALYNINNTPFIMTRNLIASWGGIRGFQGAYWSINLVDFSALQWQSASANWMGAVGLQWADLMKRSCMSGDDVNKAKRSAIFLSLVSVHCVKKSLVSSLKAPWRQIRPSSGEWTYVSLWSSHFGYAGRTAGRARGRFNV